MVKRRKRDKKSTSQWGRQRWKQKSVSSVRGQISKILIFEFQRLLTAIPTRPLKVSVHNFMSVHNFIFLNFQTDLRLSLFFSLLTLEFTPSLWYQKPISRSHPPSHRCYSERVLQFKQHFKSYDLQKYIYWTFLKIRYDIVQGVKGQIVALYEQYTSHIIRYIIESCFFALVTVGIVFVTILCFDSF